MSSQPKIDFVIIWVDGSDPQWQKSKAAALKQYSTDPTSSAETNHGQMRYREWGTLKYWFRAVETYAPWVNKIYFVTCGQTPQWLDTTNPKLVLINHKDIIPAKDLPTFNSNAIEINLHRIPNLSENFVYFNDDMFITDYVQPTDFFKNNLPCNTATLGIVTMTTNAGYADFNNTRILNKYFNKKTVIKQNFSKWFNLKYSPYYNLKTLLLLFSGKRFSGLTEYHIASSLKKSTFKKLWGLEPEILATTSAARFRSNSDVSQWLFKNWQTLSGDFSPRSSSFGKSYEHAIDHEICSAITSHKYKMICVNDIPNLTESQFRTQRQLLLSAFDTALPQKSSFEL